MIDQSNITMTTKIAKEIHKSLRPIHAVMEVMRLSGIPEYSEELNALLNQIKALAAKLDQANIAAFTKITKG